MGSLLWAPPTSSLCEFRDTGGGCCTVSASSVGENLRRFKRQACDSFPTSKLFHGRQGILWFENLK